MKPGTRFRCRKCRSTHSKSVRAPDDDGRIVSWTACARCEWRQDPTSVQYEFVFEEEVRNSARRQTLSDPRR